MLKIMIAEDDRELRYLFSHVLEKNGYEVYGVGEGLKALKALENDLIISDIMMPQMDGYELVRRLRANGNQTPVLMITARDTFEDMRLVLLVAAELVVSILLAAWLIRLLDAYLFVDWDMTLLWMLICISLLVGILVTGFLSRLFF